MRGQLDGRQGGHRDVRRQRSLTVDTATGTGTARSRARRASTATTSASTPAMTAARPRRRRRRTGARGSRGGRAAAARAPPRARSRSTRTLTLVAAFTATPKLTVATAGDGAGSVISDTGGIDCGVSARRHMTRDQRHAHRGAGGRIGVHRLVGGGCSGTGPCTLTVTAGDNVIATFASTGADTHPRATRANGHAHADGPPAPLPATTTSRRQARRRDGPAPPRPSPTRGWSRPRSRPQANGDVHVQRRRHRTGYRCALTARARRSSTRPAVTDELQEAQAGQVHVSRGGRGPAGTDATPASKTITVTRRG